MLRLIRASVIVLLLLGAMALTGCTSGPQSVADRFVKAVNAKKMVEAGGYLSDYEGDGSDLSAFVPQDSKADFRVTEKSDSTAKVTSASDGDDYMELAKSDQGWKIIKAVFQTSRDSEGGIDYETTHESDPSMWENTHRTSVEGQNGSGTYRSKIRVTNGQEEEVDRQLVKTAQEPVSEVIQDGTKPTHVEGETQDMGSESITFGGTPFGTGGLNAILDERIGTELDAETLEVTGSSSRFGDFSYWSTNEIAFRRPSKIVISCWTQCTTGMGMNLAGSSSVDLTLEVIPPAGAKGVFGPSPELRGDSPRVKYAFTITRPGNKWPAGTYTARILANGEMLKEQQFTVSN